MNINLGNNTIESERAVEKLKCRELENIEKFEENNPEVNLPGELGLENLVVECSEICVEEQTPLKETSRINPQTWAQVVSSGKAQKNEKIIHNDRSILEH